tara:strand:- start:8473 stop:8709 length:237 start_codon:yes stop_codon:yes gene_type:complete
MADYTITLTDTEVKSMKSICSDVDEWITNAAQNRARIAKEDILAANMAHCNANGIALATGEDAQVQQAYDLKVVEEYT